MMRIKDKIAIVTGGAGRIGQAIARRLAAEGAAVVVCDVAADRAEAVAADIRTTGGNAIALAADVSKSAEIQAVMNATIDRFGGIDILVNNAGGSAGLLKRLSLFEDSEEDVWKWACTASTSTACHRAPSCRRQPNAPTTPIWVASAAPLMSLT